MKYRIAGSGIAAILFGLCAHAAANTQLDAATRQNAHGRDERLGIDAYYTGVEFYYLFLKALTTPAG